MDLEEIKKGLSTEKLETYRQVLSCDNDYELIALYMAMQEIMSHFFTVVQLLEVTLRNSIHKAATAHFNNEEWFNCIPITKKSKAQVAAAYSQCIEEVGAKYTTDDLISRLPFGFWVHMLSKVYNNPRDKEHNLWQFKLNTCFANLKTDSANEKLSLNSLFQTMGTLNKFRNRLFHHEPAWKSNKTKTRHDALAHLKKMYEQHLKIIAALSASQRELITLLGIDKQFYSECSLAKYQLFTEKLTSGAYNCDNNKNTSK